MAKRLVFAIVTGFFLFGILGCSNKDAGGGTKSGGGPQAGPIPTKAKGR